MSVRQHLKSPVANLQWLPCFCGNCMLPRHAFQLSVCLEMLWSRQDAGSGDIIQSCQGFVFIPFRLLFPKQWSPRLLGFWHNFSENIQYYYIRSTFWFICTVDWVWQVTIHWWTSALRIMTSLPSPHPAVPGASPCRCGNSEPPPGPEYSKPASGSLLDVQNLSLGQASWAGTRMLTSRGGPCARRELLSHPSRGSADPGRKLVKPNLTHFSNEEMGPRG